MLISFVNYHLEELLISFDEGLPNSNKNFELETKVGPFMDTLF